MTFSDLFIGVVLLTWPLMHEPDRRHECINNIISDTYPKYVFYRQNIPPPNIFCKYRPKF